MCADNNLLDRWLDLVHNPRPGLIVVDMQNDFITGNQPASNYEDNKHFRERLNPMLEGLDNEISIHYAFFQSWARGVLQYKPF